MIKLKRPNTIALRELTDDGIIKFFNVMKSLNELKKKKINTPENVLEKLQDLPEIDDDFSISLFNSPTIDLTLNFKNRYFFAEYLYNNIDSFVKEKRLSKNYGVWAWLALAYIEILTDNFKNILEKYHYLPDAGIIKRTDGVPLLYRHSVRESYLLYANYKEESKIYFTRKTMSQMSDFLEQSRGFTKMRRHKSMHSYLVKKYRDPNSGYLITGAANKIEPEKNKGRNSVRRIGELYNCLAVSYAAPRLTSVQLGRLLGKGLEIE